MFAQLLEAGGARLADCRLRWESPMARMIVAVSRTGPTSANAVQHGVHRNFVMRSDVETIGPCRGAHRDEGSERWRSEAHRGSAVSSRAASSVMRGR